MLIKISPKYTAPQAAGYIQGKSALHSARIYTVRQQNFTGRSFGTRGHYISTPGRDKEKFIGTYRSRNK